MKQFIIGIGVGIVLSIIAYMLVRRSDEMNTEKIVVDHVKISGEDIIHTDIKIKRNVLEFNTTSHGKGKSKTKIKIPYKKHIFQGSIIYDEKNKMSFCYLRSFNDLFSFGGGVLISKNKFEGIQLLGQIKL